MDWEMRKCESCLSVISRRKALFGMELNQAKIKKTGFRATAEEMAQGDLSTHVTIQA